MRAGFIAGGYFFLREDFRFLEAAFRFFAGLRFLAALRFFAILMFSFLMKIQQERTLI